MPKKCTCVQDGTGSRKIFPHCTKTCASSIIVVGCWKLQKYHPVRIAVIVDNLQRGERVRMAIIATDNCYLIVDICYLLFAICRESENGNHRDCYSCQHNHLHQPCPSRPQGKFLSFYQNPKMSNISYLPGGV